MYNRLYSYLNENKILYNEQFGIRKRHSTEHAIVQPIDKMCDAFSTDKYFLGIFIDLSKAFDTVDHILVKKLEMYVIQNNNLNWFKNCLSNRTQFTEYNNNGDKTDLLDIKCGVPQEFFQKLFFFS